MQRMMDTRSIDDYQAFLRIRGLPTYQFNGCFADYPDEYSRRVDGVEVVGGDDADYHPKDFLFDFQSAIVKMALDRRKFCVFADCGLGKTLIMLEYARYVLREMPRNRSVLIISPLMVIQQTIDECKRFYGDSLPIERVESGNLNDWTANGGRLGIVNYEAFNNDIERRRVGCMIVDESSMLKSHYGKWGNEVIKLGRGLDWKLALTGTPAPNDRIEYANHAVLMDAFPTVNSFLARYFVNRGQTQNRWEIKPHAVRPFYKDLSHWCIFLTDPTIYGWHKPGGKDIPPINIHIHDVPLTGQQRDAVSEITGQLFVTELGGITTRSKLAAISKGWNGSEKIATNKNNFIRSLIDSWPGESTLIWCIYNREQDAMRKTFPEAASISGDTPHAERMKIIDNFKAGRVKILIAKPKILGFGLNLQVATRQVFSGLQDSYESFYQAVKRSNRYGATKPLDVHIPVTEIERPMIQTVLDKAARIHEDTITQERLFNESR